MAYQPQLDAAFGALSDATRRSILAQLARGDRSISDLARNSDMTLPAVSKHVRVLQRAGLPIIRQEGRDRRGRHDAAPQRDAPACIDGYRRVWEASCDRLADFLDQPLTEEAPSWQPPRPQPAPPLSSKSGARSKPRARGSSP